MCPSSLRRTRPRPTSRRIAHSASRSPPASEPGLTARWVCSISPVSVRLMLRSSWSDYLPKICSRGRHFSPTLGAFLRSAVAHPGEVELHGYCVGPDREDERVSVEGVFLYAHPELLIAQQIPWPESAHPASCECAELWRIAQHDYGLADSECPPDEYGRFHSSWRPDEHCWRLWWD